MTQLTLWPELLVVGLDQRSSGTVRLAFLDPEAVGYPDTWDLHSCRNLRGFERYWDTRFKKVEPPRRIIVGLGYYEVPGLALWLAERGVRCLDLQTHDLRPFLRESLDYEVPPRYRRAHALAQCAAVKLNVPTVLAQLHTQLNELNFALREVERALSRAAAASTCI